MSGHDIDSMGHFSVTLKNMFQDATALFGHLRLVMNLCQHCYSSKGARVILLGNHKLQHRTPRRFYTLLLFFSSIFLLSP